MGWRSRQLKAEQSWELGSVEGQHLGKRWAVFGEKGSVNKRLSENEKLGAYFSEKLAAWVMFKWLKIFYYGNLECYKKI